MAHAFTNQFESYEDLEKIKTPVITLDQEKEKEIRQMADMLFDGIIDYKMTGQTMHLGLWDWISERMGIENCYFALMDEPELIHALMDKLTNCTISAIEQMNKIGGFDIFSTVCHCSHTFTEDLPSASSDPEQDCDGRSYELLKIRRIFLF